MRQACIIDGPKAGEVVTVDRSSFVATVQYATRDLGVINRPRFEQINYDVHTFASRRTFRVMCFPYWWFPSNCVASDIRAARCFCRWQDIALDEMCDVAICGDMPSRFRLNEEHPRYYKTTYHGKPGFVLPKDFDWQPELMDDNFKLWAESPEAQQFVDRHRRN